MVKLTKVPRIMFLPEVMDDIEVIVELSDKEVGWLGHVVKSGDDYVVDDIYIPKQQVHATTAEISADGQVECLKDTGWGYIGLWGHSHVNMSTNGSSQDDKQFEDIYKNEGVDFFIRQISNKQSEHSLSLYDGIRGYIIDDLRPARQIDNDVRVYWTEELKAKVSTIAPKIKQVDSRLPAIYNSQGDDIPMMPGQMYRYSPNGNGKIEAVQPTIIDAEIIGSASDPGRMTRKQRKELRKFLKGLNVNPNEYVLED